jgi:hypothetical protein
MSKQNVFVWVLLAFLLVSAQLKDCFKVRTAGALQSVKIDPIKQFQTGNYLVT